jgi:hypothetical protein
MREVYRHAIANIFGAGTVIVLAAAVVLPDVRVEGSGSCRIHAGLFVTTRLDRLRRFSMGSRLRGNDEVVAGTRCKPFWCQSINGILAQ